MLFVIEPYLGNQCLWNNEFVYPPALDKMEIMDDEMNDNDSDDDDDDDDAPCQDEDASHSMCAFPKKWCFQNNFLISCSKRYHHLSWWNET